MPRTDLPASSPTVELSLAQERMWFLEQFEPGDIANQCSTMVELAGALNVSHLQQCVNEIVRRHEALRTRFVTRDGRPRQVIEDSAAIAVRLVDLSSVEADDDAIKRMAVESFRQFSLDQLPLIRLTLFRCAPTRHVLQLTAHHIIWDAWSVGVVLRELLALLDDYGVGRPSQLDPLRAQYRDFADAERRASDGPAAESELAFWRERLSGLTPLSLPTDRLRAGAPTFRLGSHTFHFPEGLLDAIQTFCSDRRVTPFMFVLSALQLYLSFVSGQKRVTVGVPVANRARPEWEGLAGLFMNVLVFNSDIRDDDSYEDFLDRVRDDALSAYAHGAYPFSKVVEQLRPARTGISVPLFQVMLVFLNAPTPKLELPGLTATLWYVEGVTSKQDLTLTLGAQDDRFFAAWEYNAELFQPATIQRFAQQFARLLEALADGRQPSPSLLLTAEEEDRIRAWNATDRPSSLCGTLGALLTLDHPADRIAVQCGDEQMTFGALRARVAEWAERLRASGVGPETRVGVLMPRLPDLITGMLAVWAAGGGYIPIDERWPLHRIAETIAGAGIELLLIAEGTRALAERLAVRNLDLSETASDAANADRSAAAIAPSNLAYAIFTSGSTGRPKGIEVSRAAVWNLLEAIATTLQMDNADVFLAVTAMSFDIAVLEWAAPLMTGGRVVLVEHERVRDPHELLGEMERHRPTRMQATPSLWRMLVDEGWAGDDRLDVLCGGEALSDDLASRLLGRCRNLWNLYGPTETTVWSMWGRVATPTPDLGAPIANTTVHLLSRDLAPAPAGIEAEIFIGGIGVARGYLDQPMLTAERFLPDPFSARAGARMYSTGDLACRENDGRLRFRSRADGQLKVRGLRVEPGDIEACLRSHPLVREAAVRQAIEREKAPLIAYLVLNTAAAGLQHAGAASDVLQWARDRLPDHMVPARLVVIDAMPLTTSGKIDRAALPIPEATTEPDRDDSDALCLSPLDQEALAAWEQSLGRARINARDNFFDLGGNSIIAAQVCMSLTRTLGVRVPVRLMFECPVFELFAARLRDLRAGEWVEPLPRVEADLRNKFEPFPLTDVQEAYLLGRGRLFDLGEVSTHSYFEIDSARIDVDRFELVWRKLIQRHDMLRAVFSSNGAQRVLSEVPQYTIDRVDASGLDDDARERRLQSIRDEMSHAVHPADEWPLFEIRATRITKELTRFHVSVDALIADAFSSVLLTREWDELYREPAAELPQPEIGFRDYVLASRALETTETYRRSEQYWIDHLDPSLRGPDLPVVQQATETPARFARRSARLARSEWQTIRATALRNGLSPTTVALTAFAEVLAFWSRTKRFLLNITLFNRLPLHPDVNRLVGDFTSITVLEVDRRTAESFATSAARMQQRLWDDLDHRFFSGIRALRNLRQRSGAGPVNLAPVVFTSTLGMNGGEQTAEAWGQEVFSISQTPQVWLDHKIFEDEGGLGIDWDFAEGLFAEGVVDAMFDAYIRLLKAVANREETWRMDARSLRQEIFNCGARDMEMAQFAGVETLHGLFLEQARAQPERIAVCARDRRVTFGELDGWSAAYCAELTERGIAPEELVAVVAPKGWEQAVAALAALRAGGSYVPIEPGEPEDRRLRMLRNAGVRFALTTPELATSLAWAEGCHPIPVVPRTAGPVCEAPVDGHRRAYVIYTSGSTGQPKGVMIEHRSAVNTLRDLVERLGLQPTDRALALSALSFDLSVFDLFGIWCAGGAVVYPDPARSKDPEHWAELLESEAVTVWNTVPAQMEMLVEATRVRNTPLRQILLSGDWIPVALPQKIRERWPYASQLSLGGATEASIWSILHPIERVDPSWARIPYGRAMKNQSVAVLNELLEQAPTWVVGEIFIGGIGVARGYLNDPSLTEERFIRHPVSGDRLYRTGDLGRYLPNGEIDILGRMDQQVKVNGYRIELAEIEAVLRRQAGIERALINLERDVAGRPELVAYLVEESNGAGLAMVSREAVAGLSSKLAQRGIRNVAEDATHIELQDRFTPEERRQAIARQSYRFFAAAPASMASAHAWLSAVERRLAGDGLGPGGPRSLEWFERAVCQLKQGRVEGNPFPKYRYPSAGSLYPVQTYFGIPQNSIPGIERGVYYYDPRAHALVRLADNRYPACSPPRIMFVAELNAIEDIYGEASLRFCALEAGYMYGLFLGGLLRQSAPIEEAPLSGSQRVIATFEWDIAPQTRGPEPGPLVFWVGANGLHGTEPGFYLYDSTRGLVRCATNAAADPAWFGPNQELFERSHFAVVTVARDSTVESYMGAGALGQALMEEAVRFDIGLCPIGEISDRFLDAAGMSGSIAHGWCAGRIDPAQTLTWMEAPPRLNRDALRRRCRERVARHLPAYMHPAKYLFVTSLPLTANGKVNRAMLEKMIHPDDSEPRAGMAAECSDVERAIAQMLEEVLKEPAPDLDRSFFDMGASSMVIVQLYGLVNQRYPDRVTFQDFFDNPSVRGIARCIEGVRAPQPREVTEVIEL